MPKLLGPPGPFFHFVASALRACGLAALLALAAGAARADQDGLRGTMDYMAGEFATALRLASARRPLTQAERVRLDGALDELAEQGALLSAHVSRDEFALMAANLRYLAQSMRWEYRRGEQAAFQNGLDDLLEACAACHRRSAPRTGSGFAQVLVDPDLLAEVGLQRRIRILIATRQFEAAVAELAAWTDSRMGDSRDWNEAQDLLRTRIDLGVRILPDRDGVDRALARAATAFADKATAAQQIARWRAGMVVLPNPPEPPSLPALESLVDLAGRQPEDSAYPLYLAASRLSHELFGVSGLSDVERSRVFFLAGNIETSLGSSRYLPLRELYFERAIVAAPGGPSARPAYQALERAVSAQFQPTEMPLEVRAHLAGLEAKLR